MSHPISGQLPAPAHAAAPSVSVVIPAYNEERFIGATLRSVRAALKGIPHEVIVVDNGSSDGTARLAEGEGARVITRPGRTIGAVRNAGARLARGTYLVFIDADVTLTRLWRSALPGVIGVLERAPRTLAGSMCSVPAGASWVERVWFAPQADESLSHLGSAHLIVRRSFFGEIGGFDESLATGEDYEISMRVVRAGGTIHRLSPEVVEHHGYPTTLTQFARREIWHGTGDCGSASAVLASRVAMAALVFAALHLLAAGALAAGRPAGALLALALVVGLCGASSAMRYRRRGAGLILANTALHYVYYAARALSFVPALGARRSTPAATLLPAQAGPEC